MNFDTLDKTMRVYETAADLCVLPDVFMVARLDGRGFTKLTKDICQFEAPFDIRFRDLMVETARSLMACGFRVRYAYTESDEISLLFEPDEDTFGRKLRKFQSVLAGEASSHFTWRLGRPAAFDCRISQLPTRQRVVDYFRWRNEDAARNALNAWCYWTLRKSGLTARGADRAIQGKSTAEKNELLFQHGIHYQDLPVWQKRGVGLIWRPEQRTAQNPVTGQPVAVVRRAIQVLDELPMREAYGEFIGELL
jgi:tRNA(His) 5'-end guanylyltransferase